jgi:hypothetical protein
MRGTIAAVACAVSACAKDPTPEERRLAEVVDQAATKDPAVEKRWALAGVVQEVLTKNGIAAKVSARGSAADELLITSPKCDGAFLNDFVADPKMDRWLREVAFRRVECSNGQQSWPWDLR